MARPPDGRVAASVAQRLAVFAVVAIAVGLTAQAGAWFVPFVFGVAVGALRVRGAVLPAVAGAVAGWAVPLWVLALRGLPAGATAHVIAGLAGLPPYAGTAVAVTLLLAAFQVLAGAWLARALLALAPRRKSRAPEEPG